MKPSVGANVLLFLSPPVPLFLCHSLAVCVPPPVHSNHGAPPTFLRRGPAGAVGDSIGSSRRHRQVRGVLRVLGSVSPGLRWLK